MKDDSTMSRRGLLAGVPAMAVAVAPAAALALSGLPADATADPVFAAIAEYKRANRAFYDEYGKLDDFELDSLEYDEQQEIVDGLGKVSAAAGDNVETLVPVSIAGAAALLRFLDDEDLNDGVMWDRHMPMLRNAVTALQRLKGRRGHKRTVNRSPPEHSANGQRWPSCRHSGDRPAILPRPPVIEHVQEADISDEV
jgi:hypothetical protein